MARGYLLALAALVALLVVTPARADSRVALVIGNSKYQNVPFLPNPTNDAADISQALKRLGFAVRTLSDAGFDDMRRAMREFGRQARDADMALVFFAGHGMEIGGENWLIPVDAELRSDTDAENEAVSLRSVTLQVATARQLGLVILDACRNNPFAAKMNRAVRTRAVERGFARVEPADNVLVAYGAKDGTTANDGDGRNSPFTGALLKHIETPGLEIQFMFRNVRDDVMTSTRREQQPFVYGSLSREAIYLKAPLGKPEQAKPNSVLPPADPAAQAWTAMASTSNAGVLEEFIKRYGDSFYATLARARLDELNKQQAALAAPRPIALPDPTPAPAAAPQKESTTWGCFARHASGASSRTWNYATQAEARKAVLENCAKTNGGSCKLVNCRDDVDSQDRASAVWRTKGTVTVCHGSGCQLGHK